MNNFKVYFEGVNWNLIRLRNSLGVLDSKTDQNKLFIIDISRGFLYVTYRFCDSKVINTFICLQNLLINEIYTSE